MPENPSAFPLATHDSGFHLRGMTLRDYFASAALSGLLADPRVKVSVSKMAWEYADAMLAERARARKEEA